MRLQTCLKIGGAILITGFLAACGSSNSPSSPVTVTPPASLESQFGAGFAKIFDASSTAQPAVPDANSVPALAPAATPIAVP